MISKRSTYVPDTLRPKKRSDFEICMDANKFRSYHIRPALDPSEGPALCGVFCDWNSGFAPISYKTPAPVQEWWCDICLDKAGGMRVLEEQDLDMRIEPRHLRKMLRAKDFEIDDCYFDDIDE